MDSRNYYRTSELAHAVGVHPNTVRKYVEWGLLPPVERSPSGYRLFTQHHFDCLRLARTIYAAEYPGRDIRASGNEIIQQGVLGDWNAALEKAHDHLAFVREELDLASAAAALLEHWVKNKPPKGKDKPRSIGEVSQHLGVSRDKIRNWERNGLISVPRNPYNRYRLYRQQEIERLQIIRMLTQAGYSHMAILRMFIELDKGNTRALKKVLNTPREDEDIFTAADHWLTALERQENMARQVIQMIEALIAKRMASSIGG
jgi:DNA-binding transcriptional MerR regulator